ncbi:hypothetical protein NUU61_003448 [Penicillium alfredii]|uniref:Uncharacterized protein n=1 Tax=Penicillium alfredii TaxID=1506179 RepID=A0A9W9FJ67_9EURO|nr:uncharacterized protein NUU61_003448 [Penicillium alfredii]KAJ5101226.1 hypothetical protein NUU61_003448 [Penicillium alfredii]
MPNSAASGQGGGRADQAKGVYTAEKANASPTPGRKYKPTLILYLSLLIETWLEQIERYFGNAFDIYIFYAFKAFIGGLILRDPKTAATVVLSSYNTWTARILEVEIREEGSDNEENGDENDEEVDPTNNEDNGVDHPESPGAQSPILGGSNSTEGEEDPYLGPFGGGDSANDLVNLERLK